MANENYEDFLRRASNYRGGNPEYYEDTHDAAGNYIGGVNNNATGGYSAAAPYAQSSPYNGGPAYGQQSLFGYQNQNSYVDRPTQSSDVIGKTEKDLSNPPKFKYTPMPEHGKAKSVPLPDQSQYISPRMYQNIVMYKPRTTADVEKLIGYLRRLEPAIIDLNPMADSPDAQRILDFTSGATFALNGRIIEITENIYMVVPEGVDVAQSENE